MGEGRSCSTDQGRSPGATTKKTSTAECGDQPPLARETRENSLFTSSFPRKKRSRIAQNPISLQKERARRFRGAGHRKKPESGNLSRAKRVVSATSTRESRVRELALPEFFWIAGMDTPAGTDKKRITEAYIFKKTEVGPRK